MWLYSPGQKLDEPIQGGVPIMEDILNFTSSSFLIVLAILAATFTTRWHIATNLAPTDYGTFMALNESKSFF